MITNMKMKKLTVLIAAAVLITAALATNIGAASYKKIPITKNGKTVMVGEALLIEETTYVPFRAVCDSLGNGSVTWDDASKTAGFSSSKLKIKATLGDNYIEANGRYFYCEKGIKIVGDKMYVPIRPMAKAFCVDVKWDPSYRVELSGGGTLQSASDYYDSGELYWLSRIISAESKGDPLLGKIAVGNVVLNRVKSSIFPSSVYNVIFQSGQFSPVSNGTVYDAPTAESVIAAKICLEGYSVSEEILYFCNPKIAVSTWMQSARPYVMTIANHAFYG